MTAKTYDRQTAKFLSVVGENMPEVSGDVMQGWIENPKALQNVLRNALCPPENAMPAESEFQWRTVENLGIQIPALGRPTFEELQKKFSWIKSIKRDTSPTEAVTLTLATMLHSGETRINGVEYERRLLPIAHRVLGYQQLDWLIANQDQFPDFAALCGKIYIDFSGLVVVGESGDRCVLDADDVGKRWCCYWGWLGGDFHSHGRIALSSK